MPESDLIAAAAKLRDLSSRCFSDPNPVLAALKYLKQVRLKGEDKPLVVEIVENRSDRVPAQVKRKPLRLIAQRSVIEGLNKSDPYSMWVIAHELGHVVLHNHYTHRFTPYVQNERNFRPQEDVEWQADTFAAHFLVPLKSMSLDLTADHISKTYRVPEQIAELQLAAAREHANEAARSRPTCFICSQPISSNTFQFDDTCADCVAKSLI